MTRAQAAKRPSPPPRTGPNSTTTGPPPASSSTGGGGKGSSIFSRSKEGLRKVSEKLKEKDQGVHHQEMAPMPSSSSAQSVASLEALKVRYPIPLRGGLADIQAYLRIRPCPADGALQKPYLNVQNEREVLMRSDMVSCIAITYRRSLADE
jgi:kinesin family protein 20